jgi:hypothetical protein
MSGLDQIVAADFIITASKLTTTKPCSVPTSPPNSSEAPIRVLTASLGTNFDGDSEHHILVPGTQDDVFHAAMDQGPLTHDFRIGGFSQAPFYG